MQGVLLKEQFQIETRNAFQQSEAKKKYCKFIFQLIVS